MWQICLNYHQRMGILPLKKHVNRDKCRFATKQRMFRVFAIDEILRYWWTRFVSSRTLCHPAIHPTSLHLMYDKNVKAEVDKCDVTEDWENPSYVWLALNSPKYQCIDSKFNICLPFLLLLMQNHYFFTESWGRSKGQLKLHIFSRFPDLRGGGGWCGEQCRWWQ